MEVIYFLLFIVASIFCFYIPGKVIAGFFNILAKGYLSILVSVLSGIVSFILIAYALAWLYVPYFQYVVLLFFAIIYFFSYRRKEDWKIRDVDKFTAGIIILGSLCALSLTVFSGLLTSHGWQYTGINAADGLVNISRIKNLTFQFPPTHPGLAGIPFRGYHYFYDFLVSRFIILFGFSAEDLYFRFFSLLVSLLYGLSFYAIAAKLTQKTLAQRLIVFAAYFSTGFGIFAAMLNSNYNSMMSDPLTLIFDPSMYLSVSLLLIGLVFLTKIRSFRHAIFLGLVFGVLSQIKIYTGIIGISVVSSYLMYDFVKFRWRHFKFYFVLNAVTAITTALTFFPNNLGTGSLIFDPLVFYSHYVQQAFFNPWHWEIRRMIFVQHHNVPRILILYAEAFVVFWILALGFRVLSLIFCYKLFSKGFWRKDDNFILCIIFTVCLLIPTLFIQSISVFDISQFFWIFVALINIPLGISLFLLYQKYQILGKVLIVIFIGLCIFGLYNTFQKWVFVPQSYVLSQTDARLLDKLQQEVAQNKYIAVLPLVDKGKIIEPHASLISAVTGRSTYYEDEIIKYPLDSIYQNRENVLLNLYDSIQMCNQKHIQQSMDKIDTKFLVTYSLYSCLERSNLIEGHETGNNVYIYKFK